MKAKHHIKVSSGDRDGMHPYTSPLFWIDSKNWWWLKYHDSGLNERMWRRIVEPALKECHKKNRL